MAKSSKKPGPSLFDGPAETTAVAVAPTVAPPEPAALTPHQLMWAYVAQTIGETAARANRSQVGKLARLLLEAGITPEEYRAALPRMLAKCAAGRIVTIGFLTQHWPYLRGEGMTTGRNPLQDAIDAQADIESRNGSFTF